MPRTRQRKPVPPDPRVDVAVQLTATAVGALVAVLEQTLADRRLSYSSQARALDVLAELDARCKILLGREVNDLVPESSPLWAEFKRRRK